MKEKIGAVFSWIGSFGSLFAGACCFGIAPVLALTTSLGLGFLIDDAILQRLMIFSLLITAISLFVNARRHKKWVIPVLGTVGGFGMWYFIFGHYAAVPAYSFAAVMFLAVVLDAVFLRRCRTERKSSLV